MMNRGKTMNPGDQFSPEDLVSFLELKSFSKLWTHFKLTDDDLLDLQLAIMGNPKGHPVIPDCGGVRKLRFAPMGSSSGKRESMRCCYKYFEEHKIVVLAAVYPKSVKENISADDKRRIRNAIEEIESMLNG